MSSSDVEGRVRAQYEQFPYPLRTPEEDARRVRTKQSPLESVRFVRHFGFGGRPIDRPLRILVAGGGTGDATVHLGWQLAQTQHGGEIVHLDLSEAAIAVALDRARRLDIPNVTAHRGSLLEADVSELGRFDYINCSGVLHHLPDPWAGLRALRRLLTDDGVMGIMVYGRYGRDGIYSAQDLLRRLSEDYPLPEQLAIGRRVLPQLPLRHPLSRSRLRYREGLSDNEVVDRYLHPCDRAFSVPEVVDWLRDSAMRVIDFVPSIRYSAALMVSDPWILSKLAQMPQFDRYAVAELWSYQLDRHSFFAVRDDNPVNPPTPGPDVVATVRDSSMLLRQLQNAGAFQFQIDSVTCRVPVSPTSLHFRILEALDGERTLGAIAAALQVSWDRFLDVFLDLYVPLGGACCLTLSHPEA